MAGLLYQLGRWCADHAGRVVALWLALIVAVGGAAAAFSSPMTTKFAMPDSQFQQVLDDVATQIPEFKGGAGTVVLESETGSFTRAQRAAIEEALSAWESVDHVSTVNDPFAAQAGLDRGRADLVEARRELLSGTKELADGREQLDAAQSQVAQGEGLIDLVAAKDPDDPTLGTLRPRITKAREEVQTAESAWAEGKKKLDGGWIAYNTGGAQVDAIGGMRFVTADQRFALVRIQFDDELSSVPHEVRSQIPVLGSRLADSGVRANYSAELVQDTSLVGPGEVVGLMVAVGVLVLMLGTLLAAGLPLLGAVVGVAVGLAAALATSYFFDMNQMTPALALMLGLAVGIDYALFIVNRHRSMYLHGASLNESIARAVGTAGSAVTFAGVTVIIALAALTLSGIPLLAQMGLVAAGTVAVAVAVAVTLTPALLRLIGPRVAPRRMWRATGYAAPADLGTRVVPADEHEEEHGGWYVRLATRRPWLTIAGVVAVVALLAAPATSLRLGLPDGSSEPVGSTGYTTYQQVTDNFGAGVNGPILGVATLDAGDPTPEQAQAVAARLAIVLADIEGVDGVVVAATSVDHRTIALQITPTTGPADEATLETVHALQDRAPFLGEQVGATIGFTGQTVANIELSELLAGALPGYLLTVVGLSLIILLLVFRSLIVPLVATAGFLLSVSAAFGVAVAIYQWGWLASLFGVSTPGPILSFMPIILIGVLFGLAMDYQMFLVTGMREVWAHGEDAKRAVRSGFKHGVKVVTAAAVIMGAVFGGFVFSHLAMIRPVGMGLAVGVLVDAFLVRMTLTPAVMHLLGERAWRLPAWLDRIVPNVDVEGTSLAAISPGAAPTAPTEPRPAARAAAVVGPGGS